MTSDTEVSQSVVKVAQALGFLLSLDENHKMDRLKLIKLLWAADRLHIRQYGETITGLNDYYAMAHGPVCSLALEIARLSEDGVTLSEADYKYLSEYFTADARETSMQKSPGEDALSESNQEALRAVWKMFKDVDTFVLADEISHRYPEWQKYQQGLASGVYKRHPIDQEDFFQNPDGEDDYFAEDAERLAAAHELYRESQEAQGELKEIFG